MQWISISHLRASMNSSPFASIGKHPIPLHGSEIGGKTYPIPGAQSQAELRILRYWASEFGVRASELRIAIYAVGTRASDVRAYLGVSEVIPFPPREQRPQSRS